MWQVGDRLFFLLFFVVQPHHKLLHGPVLETMSRHLRAILLPCLKLNAEGGEQIETIRKQQHQLQAQQQTDRDATTIAIKATYSKT
jgi:hypothetical protein